MPYQQPKRNALPPRFRFGSPMVGEADLGESPVRFQQLRRFRRAL